jgi:hypothetical protein
MKTKLVLTLSLLFVCISCTGLPVLPEDQAGTLDMLLQPEFWASTISAVVLGVTVLLRKRIMAAVHKYGRTEAAKRGFPSGTNEDGPVPVDKDGRPLTDSTKSPS